MTLKHYRGFSDLAIQFPKSGPAVFIGWNGAGKSSVLDAIGHTLMFYFGRQANPIQQQDIKLGEEKASIGLEGRQGEYAIEIDVSIERGSALLLVSVPPSPEPELNKAIAQRLKADKRKTNIPLVVYYPTNRLVPSSPSIEFDERNGEDSSPLDAWKDNLQAVQQYNSFFRWFRAREDIENEKRLRENPNHRDRGLDAVRGAIERSFPEFSNLYVRRTPKEEFVIQKQGMSEVLSIGQLSDGEKGVLIMIADLARRLEIANPKLEDPLQGQGVVLIDEVELHLHPAWQRRIVPALEKTFPGIQFIMTTHSPQVLSRVGREQVFVLEGFEVVEAPFTFGRDANTLLEDAFDVPERPEEAKEEFRKLYDLMDDASKQKETEQMLKEVAVKYGDDDPEVLRANMHFTFMKA